MNELLQSGLHPDAEVLSAFAEGALPAHERTHTLAHLAACAHCREIFFLAQQAAPAAAPAPASAWQRWLHSVPIFGVGIGVAALAGLALVFVTLRPHSNSGPSLARSEPQTAQPPTPIAPTAAPTPQPRASTAQALKGTDLSPYESTPKKARALAPEALAPTPPIPPLLAAAPPRPLMANRSFMGTGAGIGRAPTVGMAAPVRSMAMSSVHGEAVPQVAAAPPIATGAPLTFVPRPTTVTLGAGLPAQTAAAAPAPSASNAAADALAAPPSVSETVTVQQNADQALSMDSAQINGTLRARAMAKERSLTPASPTALPSALPTNWLVSSGPRTLAADSAGALFLSLDAGRHWQPVTAAWPGKIVQLKLAAAPAVFQLITTTGAIWLSTDGLQWHPR